MLGVCVISMIKLVKRARNTTDDGHNQTRIETTEEGDMAND